MDLNGAVALVTGANRGLGTRLVNGLLDRGAVKVYAAARNPGAVTRHDSRVVPIPLDLDDHSSVEAAAKTATDVTLLVNNAGVLAFGTVLGADPVDIERDMNTNYFGTLRVIRAFTPIVEANGGGAIVNVLTLIALAPVGGMAGYSASKAAAHSMTQSLRAELRDRHIEVIGAYPGGIDTDMLAGIDAVKAAPEEVAVGILDGVASGATTIFPDSNSASAGEVWRRDPVHLETMLAG
jgi:NAD(P)-dependent dehydrogenase (short-subunit alcohol dehydrogenase family)